MTGLPVESVWNEQNGFGLFCWSGVLTLKINRINNDNEANDANDNGEELNVGLPETERQELLRQRRETQRAIPLLRQERDRLLLE